MSVAGGEYCTPPSSDVEPDHRLPPSPPASPKPRSAVDSLISALHLRKTGRRIAKAADWSKFPLSAAQFSEFEERLAADEELWRWYSDKARWDYDSRECEYILRMPTAVHERFIAKLEDAIIEQIVLLANTLSERHEEETAVALRSIYKGRSATLDLYAPKLENSSQSSQSTTAEVIVHRSPDATFFHPEATLPALVVEVSYSQQKKDLPRLAESYIVDSQHQISCVLGLDIVYTGKKAGGKKDKTASVSVWRPAVEEDDDGENVGICQCDTDGTTFRDAAGNVCEGTIQLTMADLLPSAVLEDLPDSAAAHHITLTFPQLASFLAEAETTPTRSKNLAAPKKFRKRKRSPPEDLSDGREASYLDHEEAELEKERRLDKEWKGAGWSAEDTLPGADIEVELRRSKRTKSGRGVGDGS